MTERADHEHCSCVERLRQQNKDSSDAWTKRTADMQSDLEGLRHLMKEAATLNRGTLGLSTYGQAALAEALRIADEYVNGHEALNTALGRERRARIVAEDRQHAAERALERERERVRALNAAD